MSFLNQLKLACLGFSLRGYSRVSPAEPLSRYLTVKRWEKNKVVQHQAFLPHKEDNCTSVYRTAGLARARIRRIGEAIASAAHDGVLYGTAVISAKDVTDVSLSLKRGWSASLHVGIAGWPPRSEKDKQMSLAQQLAAKASFVPVA
jgi:hypothetical protein